MVERTASLPVIQRDARSSWSSTQLWPTRGVTNTAQDDSVLDNAFVLIDAFVMAALLSTVTAAEIALYSAEVGPHKVLTVDHLVLHDAARNKDVPVTVYYPEAPGPFPIIIFSHGTFGSRETDRALGEQASYRCVSIHPSHEDFGRDSGYRRGLMKVIRNSHLWESRPKDISFVIDSLPEIEKRVPELKRKLDRSRIGVGGHSYGAYTAEAIGGATVTMPGKVSLEALPIRA